MKFRAIFEALMKFYQTIYAKNNDLVSKLLAERYENKPKLSYLLSQKTKLLIKKMKFLVIFSPNLSENSHPLS